MKSIVTVFTDGSSRGNPGKGGWGALVIVDTGDKDTSKVIELGGREDATTNNRMEMTAALESLKAIRAREFEGDIEIHTDSAYLINGITKWVFGWEKNNWLTKEGQAVLNKDLWQGLAEITRVFKLKREIIWKKVEGHSGLRGNERVDEIATSYADNNFTLLFTGVLSNYEKMLGSDIFTVGKTAVPKKKSGSSAKAYSYVSYVDGVLYIDTTWAACEKRVKGKKGARFKKALSAEDEKAIVVEFQK